MLLIYEGSETHERVRQTSNDPRFWSMLLAAVERFAPWTEEDFSQAVLRHTAAYSTAQTWKLMGE